MSVGVAQPGVELPACPLYIGLLPDEPVALGGPPGPASQELALLPPPLRQRSGVCVKGPQ